MPSHEHLLVLVDASEASERAVAYVGRMLKPIASARVRLFHVEEPIGPEYLTVHGGAGSKPATGAAARLDAEAKRRSSPVFEKMRGILKKEGFDSTRVDESWYVAGREDDLVTETVRLAREQGMGTVVVGRTALPWHRELFHHHLCDGIVKRGSGLAVWVVE